MVSSRRIRRSRNISEFVRIPNDLKEVTPEQRESIEKIIEKLEEDEDVQNVFHNMKEDDSEEE